MGFKHPIVAAVGLSVTADGYAPMLNCQMSTNFTNEAIANTPFFLDGNLTNLFVNIWTNAATAASTFKTRKNGADGNLSITFAAGVTGRFRDDVNTDTVTNGDLCCFYLDRGGGAAMQVGQVGIYYETDSGVIVNKVGVMGSQNAASGTGYLGFIGDMTAVTDNSAAQTPRISVAGTVRNFHAYSSANTRTNTTTLQARINGADGTCGVTFNSSTTGLRTNSSNSDALSIGDNFNYERTTNTGSGTFTLNVIGCEIHYPANEAQLFSCDNGGASPSATSARYMVPAGSFAANGSETAATVRLYGSGVLSDMYYNLSANAANANVTTVLRKQSASTAVTSTVGAGTTGTQSDTTHTASFVDQDYINYMYSKPTGSGSTTYRWFSLKITYDLPPTDGNFFLFMGPS